MRTGSEEGAGGSRRDRLYEVALVQEGHFTTAQAAAAGYSPQLLDKHLRAGRIWRVRRGVYRIVHFPPGEHEDLVVIWLWSERVGVFSHETALALHQLSDLLPNKVHMTVPDAWRRRRLRVPDRMVIDYGEVSADEVAWVGPVPVTSPARTILDCAAAQVSPDVIRQAIGEAKHRGLVADEDLEPAWVWLRRFEREDKG
jgi:predicted transcriptional regulator of viral defense system